MNPIIKPTTQPNHTMQQIAVRPRRRATVKRLLITFLAALLAFAPLPSLHAQMSRVVKPTGPTPHRVQLPEDESDNPSTLLYAPRNGRAVTGIAEEGEPQSRAATRPTKRGSGAASVVETLPVSASTLDPAWNTAAGRARAAEKMAVHLEQGGVAQPDLANIMFNGQDVCSVPDLVKPEANGCCSYNYPDQLGGGSDWYRQPYHVFTMGTDAQRETAARNFAATVHASLPMFVPYKNSHVHPGGGWLYNGGDFHGAVDFGRDNAAVGTDPSFGVYAIADGKVVSVFWDNWSGNIVIIEHTAPNGDRYRSTYMHMRDGFDHDLAKAKAIPAGDKYDDNGKINNTWKYNKYAHKANPNALYWGTNSQTIQVEVGDTVAAGQFLGWSGDTGPGGAGNGLDANGDPTDPATANNHLHLMTTVPDPRPGFGTDWIQVDPYGVYNQVATGCYDLLDTAAYPRLFAPFYPSFHNVPLAVVSKYFGYYPGMGMALQTLSLHRDGNEVLASGSFQWGLSSQWYARFYMTGSDFQNWFDEYDSKGYRPREISVTPDSNGNPRFNVIWKKRAGEGTYSYFGLTDAQWQQKWNEHVVNGGMAVDEHVAYDTGSGARHAAVFITGQQAGWYEYHYMSWANFDTTFHQLANQGFHQTNMDVEEIGNGRYYGGIWRHVPGSWVTLAGMTAAEYQTAFNTYGAQGYRLYRIQGYADSSRFAAIWTK